MTARFSRLLFCFVGLSLPLSLTKAAAEYTIRFEPPYDYESTWTWDRGFALATAGANRNSGVVGAYADAFAGASASSAWHYIVFYFPVRSSVEVKTEVRYTGGNRNIGITAFSGTEFRWRLDDRGTKRSHLDR